MDNGSQEVIELRAFGANDPDGMVAASVLAAYFEVEQEHMARRRLWPAVAVCALVAWLLEATTPWLSQNGLFLTLAALSALAATSAVSEWRAERKLRALVGRSR